VATVAELRPMKHAQRLRTLELTKQLKNMGHGLLSLPSLMI